MTEPAYKESREKSEKEAKRSLREANMKKEDFNLRKKSWIRFSRDKVASN